MDANQLQELDIAVRNPETIVETPDEIAERDRLMRLHFNSNYGGSVVSYYEAGWKAAKAYYGVKENG